MSETVFFLNMFSDYRPEDSELWEQVQVRGAVIDPEERRVSVELFSPTYVSGKRQRTAISELRRIYGIHNLELRLTYPAEAVTQAEPRDLSDVLIAALPAARLILAGSKWEMGTERMTIKLSSNGKDRLEAALPRLREHLRTTFGIEPEIEIEAHAVDGDALYEETARIRQEAMKSVPTPNFKETAAKSGGGKSAPEPSGDLIFGRPFSGPATPMSELNLDMFKVIVEGEVFAVNHKELKKRNAWVVSFDMTDRTNSVRINQFMEAEKAAPILERIAKPGAWLRV